MIYIEREDMLFTLNNIFTRSAPKFDNYSDFELSLMIKYGLRGLELHTVISIIKEHRKLTDVDHEAICEMICKIV